jgi:hypothetical protein
MLHGVTRFIDYIIMFIYIVYHKFQNSFDIIYYHFDIIYCFQIPLHFLFSFFPSHFVLLLSLVLVPGPGPGLLVPWSVVPVADPWAWSLPPSLADSDGLWQVCCMTSVFSLIILAPGPWSGLAPGPGPWSGLGPGLAPWSWSWSRSLVLVRSPWSAVSGPQSPVRSP